MSLAILQALDVVGEKMTVLRMYGTASDSIVDGPGLRFSVFVQGCSHHCPGCHNVASQPFEGGYQAEVASIVEEVQSNKLIKDVTLTGGEPFDQCSEVLELACALKEKGYSLWIYSGYLYEDLMAGKPHKQAPELLACCDVLVDGPFIESLQSYDLVWKGSSNQRVIDLVQTKARGKIVLWEAEELSFEIPQSW